MCLGIPEDQAFCTLDIKKAAHGLRWYVHGNINDINIFKHGYINVDSNPCSYIQVEEAKFSKLSSACSAFQWQRDSWACITPEIQVTSVRNPN